WFFCFQAEDGIRGKLVTGVQTCALPISYKYTVGRKDLTVLAMGAEMTAAIGLNSWASFAGSAERAHIAGDMAMLVPEVNPVIREIGRASCREKDYFSAYCERLCG